MTRAAIFYDKDSNTYELGSEGDIVKQIPPGIYNATPGPFGRRFITSIKFETDKLINLEQSNTNLVMKDIGEFLQEQTRAAFKAYELLYRRGILLYGPPGTGKTSTVIQICKEFVNTYGGLVFFRFPLNSIGSWIEDIRRNDANRPVLLVMEELDGRIDNGEETAILDLLDGESNVDNLIVLATTNYIKEIPPRIKNRPSRFSTVIEIGYPGLETRRAFLESKILPQHKKEINIPAIAAQTQGMSIDHLKDLIVSIFCFRLQPETAIKKLKEMIELGADEEDD